MGQRPILDGQLLLSLKEDFSTKSWLDVFWFAVSTEATCSEKKSGISLPTLLFFLLIFRVNTGFSCWLNGSKSEFNSPLPSQTATDRLASSPVFLSKLIFDICNRCILLKSTTLLSSPNGKACLFSSRHRRKSI